MTAQRDMASRGRRPSARPASLLLTSAVLLSTILAGCGGHAAAPSPPSPSSATGAAGRATSGPVVAHGPPASTGPGAAVTLVAAGDIGRCDSTADDETGALVASLPGVVATLGDTAYEDGTTEELETCFGGSWGGVKDRIAFAVTGNHDRHTDGGEPLRAYMGSAAARDGHTWFSDDLGAWHVVVLDSDCGFLGDRCGSGSEQAAWLREDLARSSARCTLALLHQPRFSSGQHGDSGAVGALWDELSAADAELVLVGHDHDYERFAPQAPDGTPDDARGLVEIVVGTGGADLEGFKTPRPNSLVRIDDAHGVLELTLGADAWLSRFIDTDGVTRDTGSGACH
jgi:acid phosphatase type 7